MRDLPSLLIFVVLCVGGGALIGVFSGADEWYAALAKPWFNPPNWIFAPVWTSLYVLIAVAGWRTWRRERSGSAMVAWTAQMVLNFLWSPVFFALHSIGGALVVILAMLAAILAFMALVRRKDEAAFWLFAPYLAWVAFATLLNASLLWLN